MPIRPDKIDDMAARWIARRDAGLSGAEQAALDRWRQENPAHAAAFARYERTWAALARPVRTGVRSALEQELGRLERHQRIRRALGAGAGLLALGLATALWWQQGTVATPTGRVAAVSSRVLVSAPVREVLPDGSVIEHPRGAGLAVDYSGRERRVVLARGEAHFNVAKDAQRPFVVLAAGVEVRAVGTAFSVGLVPDAVEVLVTEGRVRVDPPSRAPAGVATVDPGGLGPGSRLVVGLQPEAVPVLVTLPAEEMERRMAWRKTRLEFSGATLAEVVGTLNRVGPVRYTIADPALDSMELSGLFHAEDTPAIVAILETGFGIDAEWVDGSVRLRRRR